ncbi:MAG TPA: PatB family C-S lyase [Prolixibacteraceae bacterium]|nr:PatB family C-S lyase [Prolixibacteraceae bacterium]
MKTYNFDELIDRTHTNCIKYDARAAFFGKADVLPLWVADMDFKTPDFIVEAIKKRAEHEVFGYTFRGEEYNQAIINWLKRRHNWDVKAEWITFSPGVVAGLTLAIEALSKPGEGVIIQPPVYFPFADSVKGTGRELIENPLKLENGRYYFDLEDLKSKITPTTKLLLLSNPHNPGGMAWNREELSALARICIDNKILIISDEIHSDLLLPGNRHTPLAGISEEIAQNCVICMSPSKTFNTAGLTTSYLVIPNKRYWVAYERVMRLPHLHMGNIFGNEALVAAYTHGDEWLGQLMNYLQDNLNYLEAFIKEKMPQVKVMHPDATYLIWMDFSGYGLTDEILNQKLIDAGVGLNRGVQFGKQGKGFMRINLGCPRSTLQEAMFRMEKALQ